MNETINNTMNTEATTSSPEVEVKVEVKSESVIAPLPLTASLPEVIAKVNELIEKGLSPKRDRGPESTRTMTEADARRICLGDLKDASHTKAAEATGLSYGQVYSARKGFTFKAVYQEMLKKHKK